MQAMEASVAERRQGGDAEIDQDAAWRAVITRSRSADGAFVFAVHTTGVYCRPSCPARRPKRENVTFFESPSDAERQGFRPCLRCKPRDAFRTGTEELVAKAVEYLEANRDRRVSLEELATTVGASTFHVQRKFKEIVGVSPKRYQDAKRIDRLKGRLRAGDTVSRATYEAGFGSSRAAYERGGAGLGMTPGRYRRGGAGSRIEYMIVPSSIGRVLVAATERGVCAVALGDDDARLEADLRQEFPSAVIARARSNPELRSWVKSVVDCADGKCTLPATPLDLQGTRFQLRVWEALRQIPFGGTSTYGAIAKSLGAPAASRAVGTACAKNRVALLVPCHRVVRKDANHGGYRWGSERKRRLLQMERRSTQR